MPPQNITSEFAPHDVDFGPDLSNFIKFDDDVIHDRVPGAWLDFSEQEEFSGPNMTRSKARTIAKEALADLQRASAEAENERVRRHTLRARLAAKDREQASAAAEGDKKFTQHRMSIRAILAQDNASNAPTDAPRRAAIDPSLDSSGWPNSPSAAVPGKGNVPNTPHSTSRRPVVDHSLNSGGQKAGGAHRQGFLPMMDDFNARGGAHTASTRRLVDGGFFSEEQIAAAAAAARAQPRSEECALDGQVAHRDRFAAARAKLAAEGRVVATVSQQVSGSGPQAVKGIPPRLLRPGPAQPCVTVGPSTLPTRKLKRCVPASTTRSSFNIADQVEQPHHNAVVVELSPTGGSNPEIEAGRRSTGRSVSRTLPIYALEHTPKSSSTKPATAAASTTTTTTPNQSVSEKAQAIALRYASAAKSSSKPAQKLAQGTECIDSDAGKGLSTNLTAAAPKTSTTPSQSVSAKVKAILNYYGEAMSALDEASAAAFVAHKLKQDTNRTDFNAGKQTSTPAQLKTPTTPKVQSAKGLGVKLGVVKTAEIDDGFDVLNSKGPSAANGSPLPDPDLIKDQLDVQFSPTLKCFQGWEDDYDSDDSEEWDLGGLAEWKWVGEKSAQKSSMAKGQA